MNKLHNYVISLICKGCKKLPVYYDLTDDFDLDCPSCKKARHVDKFFIEKDFGTSEYAAYSICSNSQCDTSAMSQICDFVQKCECCGGKTKIYSLYKLEAE